MDNRAFKREFALSMLEKTGDFALVAKKFNVTEKTVKKWRNDADKTISNEKISENYPELTDYFERSARVIVDKSLLLINKRIDTALKFEDELSRLLHILSEEDEISQKERTALITKLRNLEVQKIGEVLATLNSFCLHTEGDREEHDFKLEIKVDE